MSAIAAPPARAASRPAAQAAQAAEWGRILVVLVVVAWGASLLLGLGTGVEILTVLGFAAALLGLRTPALGLMGVGILGAMDAISRVFVFTGGVLRWNTLSYFLLLVAALRLRTLTGLKGRIAVLLTLLLGLLVLELAVSSDIDNGLAHVLSLSAILGLLVYVRRAGEDATVWAWLAVVTGALSAAGGVAFYVHGALGETINPNAWVYLPLTALLLADVAVARGVLAAGLRRTVLALSVVNLGWAFLSGSRGGFFASFVAMGYLLLGGRQPARVRAGAFLALAGAIAVTSLFADLQDEMDRRLSKLVDPNRTLANRTSGRSDLAIAGWQVFLEHPLGVGTGGFAEAGEEVGRRENLALYRGRGATQAHSAWIKTLAENGLPGILLLGAFVASFASSGFRRRREGLLGFGVLATTVVSVSFLSNEFQSKGLWLFVAAALVLLDEAPRRAAPPVPVAPPLLGSGTINPWTPDTTGPASR